MAQPVYVLTYTLRNSKTPQTANCEKKAIGRGFGPRRDRQGNFITTDGKTIKKNTLSKVSWTLKG